MEQPNNEPEVIGKGGWVGFEFDGAEFYVRLDERYGRLGIAELHFQTTFLGHIGGQLLRSIPWGAIEEYVNGPLAESIRDSIEEHPEATKALSDLHEEIAPVVLPLNGLDMDHSLEIPDRARGSDYGDDFYRRLAMKWAEASILKAPANAIAKANGVSVSTVHRWVKEARRRGLMAPARRRTQSEERMGPD